LARAKRKARVDVGRDIARQDKPVRIKKKNNGI